MGLANRYYDGYGPKEPLNVKKVVELLRVCRRTVLSWIHHGLLKANQFRRRTGPQQEWRIEPQDFINFIRDRYYVYDPERVRDKFLRSIIETTPAAKAIPISQAVKVLGVSSRSGVTKKAREGKLPGYKGFGTRGHTRWYVQLDSSAFQWFRDLADNNSARAAEWVIKAIETRNPVLNILLKYEPERMKRIRQIIRRAPVADRIVREFEKTPEGEKLRSLVEAPTYF